MLKVKIFTVFISVLLVPPIAYSHDSYCKGRAISISKAKKLVSLTPDALDALSGGGRLQIGTVKWSQKSISDNRYYYFLVIWKKDHVPASHDGLNYYRSGLVGYYWVNKYNGEVIDGFVGSRISSQKLTVLQNALRSGKCG